MVLLPMLIMVHSTTEVILPQPVITEQAFMEVPAKLDIPLEKGATLNLLPIMAMVCTEPNQENRVQGFMESHFMDQESTMEFMVLLLAPMAMRGIFQVILRQRDDLVLGMEPSPLRQERSDGIVQLMILKAIPVPSGYHSQKTIMNGAIIPPRKTLQSIILITRVFSAIAFLYQEIMQLLELLVVMLEEIINRGKPIYFIGLEAAGQNKLY